MPAVASYSPTGNAYIDGVLGDLKWAVNSFTYSFPTNASFYGSGYGSGETADNFGALNTTQQAAVRSSLKMYASVANLTFTEITETSTQHADLRFAESDLPGTAWAYFPTTSAVGGDAWFNSTDYNTPVKGNYAYLTFMHEIGHALGLEHAHEHFVMPADRDSMEYTVMSYRSYVGASTTSGYVNETWGYAQSLMMYDIAALQHMYGANFTTNSGNTTYKWNPATGEMMVNGVGQGAPGGNKILLTVWDGGGADTYDFSNYTSNLKVDLRPGQWTTTSTAQLAKLHYDGSKVAVGNIANALLYKGDVRSLIENAVGGSGSDTLTGNEAANSLTGGAGNDRLTGGKGNDALDGGVGIDTIVFSGPRSNYSVSALPDGSLQVTDLRSGTPDGKDLVKSAEWFQFSDKTYSLSEMTSSSIATAPQNLSISGGAGNDTLSGGAGNDTLDGKGGSDKLYGKDGADVLAGGAGRDYLDGGAGADTASYATAVKGLVADLMFASNNTQDAYGDTYANIENLTGSGYADSLRGNDAANVIRGGAGNDSLYGRGGNDVLRGGVGADMLFGGAGADVFDFDISKDSLPGARDTIKDFVRGLDHIDLRTIDANVVAAGDQAFVFIGSNAFTGQAGQLKFASGVLAGDFNGDKVADFQINVSGLSALAKDDFYL
ncbi:protease [Microvirga sp. KLBC 81]|uniref:M10 family metallopeptidase C-terminal domain-containing protein n=1 Tax=Microvirga sp. KLBC 81 TaxID=1862707 RepID=UPI000D51D31B|nr:M10 family metallopeptidase C-terminal domain-containing protein [Microvirga sp. KLBC 81]PVE24351.1 protease [Microvirga sp. KLBC 81]